MAIEAALGVVYVGGVLGASFGSALTGKIIGRALFGLTGSVLSGNNTSDNLKSAGFGAAVGVVSSAVPPTSPPSSGDSSSTSTEVRGGRVYKTN